MNLWLSRPRPSEWWRAIERPLRGRFAYSGRILAAKMLWACGPQWAVFVALMALADSLLPNVAVIAFGHAVGQIPIAARAGTHSAAGHRLIFLIVLAVSLYTGSVLVNPAGSALNSIMKVKIDQAHKRRLMTAVSGPV